MEPYKKYALFSDFSGVHVFPKSRTKLRKAYENEIKRLFSGYGTEVIIGRWHPAPCPTWRDEHVLQGDKFNQRFALRVHVFEKGGKCDPLDPYGPLLSDHLDISKHTGRYLGFVSIDPTTVVKTKSQPDNGSKNKKSENKRRHFEHILRADIAPPRRMLRPRYHLIVSTESPMRSGVIPFRSGIFVTARSKVKSRSTCLHLAVSQALHLIMGRFGCYPLSEREFTALLWEHLWREAEKNGDNSPQNTKLSINSISQNGATFDQVLAAIKDAEGAIETGGFVAGFSTKTSSPNLKKYEPDHELTDGQVDSIRREARQCLADLLSCGLPVILMVDYNALEDFLNEKMPVTTVSGTTPGSDTLSSKFSAPSKRPPTWHAMLVVGMHILHDPFESHENPTRRPKPDQRSDEAHLPGQLVIHDTLHGPFFEIPTDVLLDAAFLGSRPPNPAPMLSDSGTKDISIQDVNTQVTNNRGIDNQAYTWPGIYMLVLGPKGMRLGIDTVKSYALEQMTDEIAGRAGFDDMRLQSYCKYVAPGTSTPGTSTPETSTPETSTPETSTPGTELLSKASAWAYQIRFLNTFEVQHRYFRGKFSKATKDVIQKEFARRESDNDYWWVVEIRHPTPEIKTTPLSIFFWRITDSIGNVPLMRADYISNKPKMHMLLRIQGEKGDLSYTERFRYGFSDLKQRNRA